MKRPPVILLGLDATEIDLVERLLKEGQLPNLAALRERGVRGELRTRPEGFLSMVWPTFFTGQRLGAHGWYFNKLWNPDRQRLEYASREWLPYRPFSLDLGDRYRLALLDIPFLTAMQGDVNGVFLNGWQVHDDFGQEAQPPSLWEELKDRAGTPIMTPEVFGAQTVRSLLAQREEAIRATAQFAEVCRHVVQMEEWDLMAAVFGGAHRGAHYLWSLDQVNTEGIDAATREALDDAVPALYRAADAAVGRVLEAAPPDARVLVFALHGMGANRGWAEFFPQMVAHVHGRDGQPPARGLVYRIKQSLPWPLVRQITRRLPSSLNHALVPLWSRRMYDWSQTRFFALPLDLNGYLRINVRGRDAQGIVEPGTDYDSLVGEVKQAFLSFRDLATGKPVVRAVDDVDDLVGANAPRRRMMPDLIVRWGDTPLGSSPGIRSRYGELRWGAERRLPSGRSGNHLARGWYLAAGPGIARGADSAVRNTVDLMPTVFRWLGAPIPDRFEGAPIPVLCEDGTASAADAPVEN